MATPDRGDLVWVDFSPHAGHEQAGRRPALVLSPRSYHQKSPFAVVCPITNTGKDYPFEVALPPGRITGVVLTDQVRSIDRRERRIEPAGKAPPHVVDEVLAKLLPLLDLESVGPHLLS